MFQQWKLVLCIVGAFWLLVAGYKVNSWRTDAGAAKARIEASEARVEEAQSLLKSSQEATEKAVEARKELESIRRNTPARVVRLCPAVPEATDPGSPDGASAASGNVQAEPGPDIGGRLTDEADRTDELAEQLRELQDRLRPYLAR